MRIVLAAISGEYPNAIPDPAAGNELLRARSQPEVGWSGCSASIASGRGAEALAKALG
jgi:hypothetical protein